LLISALGLVISNLVAVWFALRDNWSLPELMTLYWCQSVIIGGFNFLRILTFRQFDPAGVRFNRRPIDSSQNSQFAVAFFFFIHFGLFHFGYAALLHTEFPNVSSQAWAVLVSALVFLFYHFTFFLQQHAADMRRRPDIGSAMVFPYARILPMHLLPLLAPLVGPLLGKAGIGLSNERSLLIAFVTLKIVADLLMHLVEVSQSSGPGREEPERGEEKEPSAPAAEWTPAEPACPGWKVFGILLILVGGGLLYYSSPRIITRISDNVHLEWVEVPCVILESLEIPKKEGRGIKTIPVKYAYTYQGKDYVGTLPNPWQDNLRFSQNRIFRAYSDTSFPYVAGMKTICHVNPDSPDWAVLSRNPPSFLLASSLILSLLPLLLLVAGIVLLRSGRTRAPAIKS